MKHPFLAPLGAALCLFGASCASTVQSRIDKYPGKFDGLPRSHQEAVRAGELRQGMSKDAVFLAWGSPAGAKEGVAGGRRYEKWRYVRQRQIVSHTTTVGWGYGRYGRYCDPYYYGGPAVTYVPYTSAVVEFRNGKVTSWERERR